MYKSLLFFILLFYAILQAEKIDTTIFSDNSLYDTSIIDKFTIMSPIEIDINKYKVYPIFFVTDLDSKDKPKEDPPGSGLVILTCQETGKSNLIIFDYKEKRDPFLTEKKDKDGSTIYQYIYLWYELDLEYFCRTEGKYYVYIINDRIEQSNSIEFDLYGIPDDGFNPSSPLCNK